MATSEVSLLAAVICSLYRASHEYRYEIKPIKTIDPKLTNSLVIVSLTLNKLS